MNTAAALARAVLLGGILLGCSVVPGVRPLRGAEETPADPGEADASTAQRAVAKRGFSLFRPTPDGLLRDFNADRPSKSDSPITVDAGRFQVETDFFNYTFDRYNPERTDTRVETLLVPSTVLKVGLLPNADLQVLLPAYTRIRTSERQAVRGREVTTVQGAADMLVRLKLNFLGNEGGNLAVGFVGSLKLPTANRVIGNGRLEGGFSLPVSLNLPGGFNLFGQTHLDVLYNGNDDDGHHVLFSNNVGLTRAVPGILDGKLSAYAEFASSVSARSVDLDPLVLTADTGLVLQVTKNVAVDFNGFFGLTRGAPDVNLFGGLAVRF